MIPDLCFMLQSELLHYRDFYDSVGRTDIAMKIDAEIKFRELDARLRQKPH